MPRPRALFRDEDDCSPRHFRLMGRQLGLFLKNPALTRRMNRCAEILEGASATAAEKQEFAAYLTKERRGPKLVPANVLTHIDGLSMAEKPTKARMRESEDNERWLREEVERGNLPDRPIEKR